MNIPILSQSRNSAIINKFLYRKLQTKKPNVTYLLSGHDPNEYAEADWKESEDDTETYLYKDGWVSATVNDKFVCFNLNSGDVRFPPQGVDVRLDYDADIEVFQIAGTTS